MAVAAAAEEEEAEVEESSGRVGCMSSVIPTDVAVVPDKDKTDINDAGITLGVTNGVPTNSDVLLNTANGVDAANVGRGGGGGGVNGRTGT